MGHGTHCVQVCWAPGTLSRLSVQEGRLDYGRLPALREDVYAGPGKLSV